MLSRPVAGVRKNTFIITLPGSPKGAKENLEAVLPCLSHAVSQLLGEPVHQRHGPNNPVKPAMEQPHGSAKHECRCFSADEQTSTRASPHPMVTVNQAFEILKREVSTRPQANEVDSVCLLDSMGFVLAESVLARVSLPPFDASIMDGYAVITEDGAGQREVVGEVVAGHAAAFRVQRGQVSAITTGAPVPAGADAIVMIEDTELVERRDGGGAEKTVVIKTSPLKGQHIRRKGVDFLEGDVVLQKGMRVSSAVVGVAAAAGHTSLPVFRKNTVTVFSTGDEVVSPGEVPNGSQVFDSNRVMMHTALRKNFGSALDIRDGGIVLDKVESVKAAILEACCTSDVVITSGGVSMGGFDHVKSVFAELGTLHIGRVRLKPGKPFTFATAMIGGRKKFLFGLPGNPASTHVTCQLFVIPVLHWLLGDGAFKLSQVRAKVGFPIPLDPNRPEYHRASLVFDMQTGVYVASSVGRQASSSLLSCSAADALLEVPQGDGELPSGTMLDAYLVSM